MKEILRLEVLLKKTNIYKDFVITRYKKNSEGENHRLYLIEGTCKNEKVIHLLRIKKSKESNLSLKKEFIYLKFLEYKGINFCPKAIFLDKKESFLIESFLEGEEKLVNKLNKKQIKLFVKQLYNFFDLKPEDFVDFCKKFNFDYSEIENSLKKTEKQKRLDSINTFGVKRLKKVKDLAEVEYQIIKEKLEKNIEAIKAKDDHGNQEKGFVWGDIQPAVIIKGDKMFFYDFDFAGFGTMVGFAYLKIHGNINSEKYKTFLTNAFNYEDKEKLIKEIELEYNITKVNDVIWAAMMYTETKDVKYLNLYNKRFKNMLENNILKY